MNKQKKLELLSLLWANVPFVRLFRSAAVRKLCHVLVFCWICIWRWVSARWMPGKRLFVTWIRCHVPSCSFLYRSPRVAWVKGCQRMANLQHFCKCFELDPFEWPTKTTERAAAAAQRIHSIYMYNILRITPRLNRGQSYFWQFTALPYTKS